ncbi:MAG: hypothetical protein ACKE5M_05975 [Methylophilaceae bacterium]
MTTIDINEINAHTFKVTVTAGNTTEHVVNVDPAYAQKLTGGNMPAADLVKKSFEFLLERESSNSILRSFDLGVINRYFPAYEREICK